MTQSIGRVYVVLVTGKLRPGCLDEYKKFLQPLAEKAKTDPNCLSFQLSTGSDSNPDAICLIERYLSKEVFEKEVLASPEFKDFLRKVQAAELMESSGASFFWEDNTFGFITKSDK